MAFRRYAKALTSKKDIQFGFWMDEMRKQAADAVPEKTVVRTAKEVLSRCDPKKYLLSHATIVASVDTYQVKGSKTGRSHCERGSEIDVRFPDYRIKPECQELVNNNGDCWERSLLMSSYKTFVGAPNYLEHIQLPALSKGFIVDAIARDIGNSCYIDILVATDRKHNQLINDIMSGRMQALSMGCISLFTVCTRCGNVASDDSQLCSHIAYDGKLSAWIDREGQEHRLSELIGHVTIPNSNQFIEASWVHNPAFRGAVRRNLLNADEISGNPEFASQMAEASSLSDFRNGGMEFSVPSRAASTSRRALDEESPDDSDTLGADDSESSFDSDSTDDVTLDSEDSGKESDSEPSSPKDKIHGLADKIKEQVLQMVVKDLSDELKPTPEDVGTAAPPSTLDLNDTILSTRRFSTRELVAWDDYIVSPSCFDATLKHCFGSNPKLMAWASNVKKGILSKNRTSFIASMSPRDIVIFSWITDVLSGKKIASDLYQTSMQIGPLTNFSSERSYIAACRLKLNRAITLQESQILLRNGRQASASKHS